MSTIIGGDGDDTLIGTDGDDLILGGAGADIIDGGNGNDTLIGGQGSDTIIGGCGDDLIYGDGSSAITGTGAVTITFEGETATFLNIVGMYTIDPETGLISGVEIAFANASAEGSGGDLVPGVSSYTYAGTPGTQVGLFLVSDGFNENDLAALGPGSFEFRDADNNPATTGSVAPVLVHIDPDGIETVLSGGIYHSAGYGDTRALNTDDREHTAAVADNGDGTVTIGFEDMPFLGDRDFDDFVFTIDTTGSGVGFPNNHYPDLIEPSGEITFTTEDDLSGDADDLIYGVAGNNTIFGGAGNDTIIGGFGNDLINGGVGDDLLVGGFGNDTFTFEDGFGNDTVIGGEDPGDGDVDVLDFSALTGPVEVILSGDEAGTATDGDGTVLFSEIEGFILTSGDDTLDASGAEAPVIVDAGDGDDTIIAGPGSTINGGDGFDSLFITGTADDIDQIVFSNPEETDGVVTFKGGKPDLVFTSIENLIVPCFTPGTLIATLRGEVLVETLRKGDRVITRDNGVQEITWIGRRDLSATDLEEAQNLRPILIRKGALGHGLPERDMRVSPNHRVLIVNDRTNLLFEEREVLVAAKHLVGRRPGIEQVDVSGVSYLHFMCARHEVVLSDGTWTESFQPGEIALAGLDAAQREELFTLFPDLREAAGRGAVTAARPVLKRHEARLLG